MDRRDPIEVLVSVADEPQRPEPAFATRLLDDLLVDLRRGGPDTSESEEIVLMTHQEVQGRKRAGVVRNVVWAGVAAAVVAGIGTVVWLRSDRDSVPLEPPETSVAPPTSEPDRTETVPSSTGVPAPVQPPASTADEPDGEESDGEESDDASEADDALPTEFEVTAPETAAAPTLSIDTARALLGAIGAVDGLELARVEDDGAWEMLTFDPNDPNRLLGDNLTWFRESVPTVVDISGGEVRTAPFNDVEGRSVGMFRPDGTVAQSTTGAFDDTMYVSSGDGRPIGRIVVGFGYNTLSGWGDRSAHLVTGIGVGCPYSRLVMGTPDGQIVLDEQDNAWAALALVGGDTMIAFPYLPELESCEPTTATATVAWDLATGVPVPDHPLAGLALARATVSANGERALVVDPNGIASVMSMATGETISTLGQVQIRQAPWPVTLNENGTLAVIVEDTGRVTLWHSDSGELLLEMTSAIRPSTENKLGVATPSFDGTRVALIDDSGERGAWRIVTLDPNEWLERACQAGFVLPDAEREQSGLTGECGEASGN